MRVLIDATSVPADRGGVGRYIEELVPALVLIGADVAAVVQPRDLLALRTAWAGADVLASPEATVMRGESPRSWPSLLRCSGGFKSAMKIFFQRYTGPLAVSAANVTSPTYR